MRGIGEKCKGMIYGLSKIEAIVNNLKNCGIRTVLTTGYFDSVNLETVKLLNTSKKMLTHSYLLVGVYEDANTLNSIEDRTELISNIYCTDYVFQLKLNERNKVISQLKPDLDFELKQ